MTSDLDAETSQPKEGGGGGGGLGEDKNVMPEGSCACEKYKWRVACSTISHFKKALHD